MFIGLFKALLEWILNYLDYIKIPSDNLEENARLAVEVKLTEIRGRKSVNEVDARTPYISEKYSTYFDPGYVLESNVCNKSLRFAISLPILEGFEEFIEFNRKSFYGEVSYEIMQGYPEVIYRGKLLKQKKVTIKKLSCQSYAQLEKEIDIAKSLCNHENIITHLFGFQLPAFGDNIFIAMEDYDESLLNWSKVSKHISFDIKDIFKQISQGLKYMHDTDFAHCSLQLRNIAITTRGGEPIYKIMNFKQSRKTYSNNDKLKEDVENLGHLFLEISRELSGVVSSSIADEVLKVDLIDRMTNKLYSFRPSMDEVLVHPFLWTPHHTLHFILKIAKVLESKKNVTVIAVLEKLSPKVFTSDWRGYIHRNVLQELTIINSDKHPRPKIVGLIKTIRNLVRAQDI